MFTSVQMGRSLKFVWRTLIRGSVQLRKTEAISEPSAAKKEDGDSFLRYLPGAVFELYEDTNGDKQFDLPLRSKV